MGTENHRAVLKALADRLKALGLESVAGALVDAARPFAPIGAGALHVAGPLLGALVGWDRVSAWAGRLEDPDTLARLSAYLAGEEPEDDER